MGQVKLNIENRGTNIVVFITGGGTNVQYWVRTSNDYTVDSTNGYDWKRLYSRDVAHTVCCISTEALVYDPSAPTNTAASKPMRFFKLGEVLPD